MTRQAGAPYAQKGVRTDMLEYLLDGLRIDHEAMLKTLIEFDIAVAKALFNWLRNLN